MATIGYTTLAASGLGNGTNVMLLQQVTAAQGGKLKSITVQCGTWAGALIKAVLCNSSKEIIATAEICLTIAYGNYDLVECFFATPPDISNGSTYYIGVINNADMGYNYDAVSGWTRWIDNSNSYASPTNPTDASSTAVVAMTIYGTFTDNEYLVASYTTKLPTVVRSMYSGNYAIRGQSFQNVTAAVLKRMRFQLKKTGSPTGNITATLYAHSGTYGTDSIPTGSVLATSDAVAASSLNGDGVTNGVWTNFVFSTPYTMAANTYYVACLNYSGGDSSNYIQTLRDDSSPTHAGNACFYHASAWGGLSGSDHPFQITGEPVVATGGKWGWW